MGRGCRHGGKAFLLCLLPPGLLGPELSQLRCASLAAAVTPTAGCASGLAWLLLPCCWHQADLFSLPVLLPTRVCLEEDIGLPGLWPPFPHHPCLSGPCSTGLALWSRGLCCQSSQQASCRLMPKDMLAVMCLYVGLMRGMPSVCSGEVASACDLGMAEVVLFPQTLPLPPPGGQSLAPACPGLASGPWQTGIALGFLTEIVGLMSHFHIVAGARLGEVPPTQAGANTSCGEEGQSHVLLSHPRAGAASPGLLGDPPAARLFWSHFVWSLWNQ